MLKSQARYGNGKLNGAFTSWYQNGRLESTGAYRDDAKTGHWIYWFEDGTVSSEQDYP